MKYFLTIDNVRMYLNSLWRRSSQSQSSVMSKNLKTRSEITWASDWCTHSQVARIFPISNKFTIFREEATSALAGFHAGPLFWSNWILEMLVFTEGGKPENLEKKPRSKARTNSKLMAPGRNQTQATLVGGECYHHYVIPAPHLSKWSRI